MNTNVCKRGLLWIKLSRMAWFLYNYPHHKFIPFNITCFHQYYISSCLIPFEMWNPIEMKAWIVRQYKRKNKFKSEWMSSIDEWMKFMWLRTSCLLSSPFGKRIVIRYIIVKNCHAGFLTCIRNGKIFCKYCSRISSVRCMEHLSKQADEIIAYEWFMHEQQMKHIYQGP